MINNQKLKKRIQEYSMLLATQAEIKFTIRDESKEVGKQLRIYREKNNTSLRNMAKQLDISAAYLSDIEVGRRLLSYNVIKKLNS